MPGKPNSFALNASPGIEKTMRRKPATAISSSRSPVRRHAHPRRRRSVSYGKADVHESTVLDLIDQGHGEVFVGDSGLTLIVQHRMVEAGPVSARARSGREVRGRG